MQIFNHSVTALARPKSLLAQSLMRSSRFKYVYVYSEYKDLVKIARFLRVRCTLNKNIIEMSVKLSRKIQPDRMIRFPMKQ